MPQGRHGLFRFGAFVAARGHRLSINVRISPPDHQHAYNAQPRTKFHLLAAARIAATVIALRALYSGAGLDRRRLVFARHRRP